jgi:hypothetical protein
VTANATRCAQYVRAKSTASGHESGRRGQPPTRSRKGRRGRAIGFRLASGIVGGCRKKGSSRRDGYRHSDAPCARPQVACGDERGVVKADFASIANGGRGELPGSRPGFSRQPHGRRALFLCVAGLPASSGSASRDASRYACFEARGGSGEYGSTDLRSVTTMSGPVGGVPREDCPTASAPRTVRDSEHEVHQCPLPRFSSMDAPE